MELVNLTPFTILMVDSIDERPVMWLILATIPLHFTIQKYS